VSTRYTISDHLPSVAQQKANKSGVIPETASLYEEAQALMFGGMDTTGNALMLGTFRVLENQSLLMRLKEELYMNWPDLDKIA
jgi:hypothetical protein